MGLILDLLQAAAAEASLHSRLAEWRKAVSEGIESVESRLNALRSSIGVQDEGAALGEFTDLDFIGAGVTVTVGPNNTAVVFIPSGGGGFPGYGGAPPNIAAASSAGASPLLSRSDHTHGHGDQAGGTLHAVATPLVAGFMSATDKAALDALVAGGPFVPTTRTLTAGAGLTGGGDLSADRTFDIVAADATITVNANSIQVGTVPVAQVSGAVPATRTLTAGAGMTGGGDLSADRTFDVGQNADNSVVVNANDIQVNPTLQAAAAAGATAVQPSRTLTAGAGLTGGGDLSANRTFDVGANADGSIVVNADDIQVSAALQAGAATHTIARIPSVLVPTAVFSRSFRYIVPTSAAGTQSMIGVVSNALAGANTPALTNTDLRTSSSRINTTSNTANVLVGQNFTDPGVCRGAVAGVGGFFICYRFAIITLNADAVVSIGLNNAVIAGGANPSGTANRIVLGADTGDANLTWISVDNGGTATKSASVISKANVIIGDPNTAGPSVFEVRMYALPNDTKITCQLINRSTESIINTSDISATLPLNTTTLRPTCVMSSKTNGAPATQCDFIHFFAYY